MGLQLGNVRQQSPRLSSSLRCSQQLVLELHRRTLHASNVHHDGLRSIFLLRVINDVLLRLRVLPNARDKGYPA